MFADLAVDTRPVHRTRRSRVLIGFLTLAAAALIAGGIASMLSTFQAQVDVPRDLAGNPIDVDAGFPSAEQIGAMDAVPDLSRLRVPAAGLDVSLGEMNTVDDIISPPDFVSAYVVRDLGVGPADAAEGTVYIAAHALRYGGVAPGNFLQDDDGRSKLSVGAIVEVGSLTYRVTGAETVRQSDLPTLDVWGQQPGRLVVITCQQYDGIRTGRNLVVTATLQTDR